MPVSPSAIEVPQVVEKTSQETTPAPVRPMEQRRDSEFPVVPVAIAAAGVLALMTVILLK